MTEKKEKRISRRPFIDTSRVQPIHVYIDRPKHRHRIPVIKPLFETLQCKVKLSNDKEALILEAEDLSKYTLEPMRKLKRLLNGKVKTTKLTLTALSYELEE
jgi:hypothetical protein